MKKILILAILTLGNLFSNAQKYELKSPDGNLKADIESKDGIFVNLTKEGNSAITLQNISLETSETSLKFLDFKVQKAIRNSINETFAPVIKEKSGTLINSYNELEIKFKTDYSITFRIFNEGLAYRFSTSLKDSLIINRENLGIHLTKSDFIRFQASKTFNSSYETPYEHRIISEIGNGQLCHLPLLVEKQNGLFVMITEADLYNYPGLWLKGTGKAELTALYCTIYYG